MTPFQILVNTNLSEQRGEFDSVAHINILMSSLLKKLTQNIDKHIPSYQGPYKDYINSWILTQCMNVLHRR